MMESKFHRLIRRDLHQTAYLLATSKDLLNPFKESAMAAKNRLFLTHHTDNLLSRTATGKTFARAFRFDEDKLMPFFAVRENIYTKNNHTPNRT